MQREKLDLISGIALLAFATVLYLFLIPTYVADNGVGAMSPRFFPRFGALLIGAGGIVLAVSSVLKVSIIGDENVASEKADFNGLKVVAIVTSMAAFILIFQWYGYLIAGPILIALLVIIFGGRNPLIVIATSLATTGALYVLFSYGLKLPLI